MYKLPKVTKLSRGSLQKLRNGDFSLGFRPVRVEIEAVHDTGKMSFRGTRRMADDVLRPVEKVYRPYLEEQCASDVGRPASRLAGFVALTGRRAA